MTPRQGGAVWTLTLACPRCGVEQEDFDGFGVLACEACGYCTHPERYGGICTICGDVQADDCRPCREGWPHTHGALVGTVSVVGGL